LFCVTGFIYLLTYGIYLFMVFTFITFPFLTARGGCTGGIPTVATDYSPLWDFNLGEWTPYAVANNYRTRLTDEFQVLHLIRDGF
jgi:hypothetical protein